MTLKIKTENCDEIIDLEQWFKYAPPQGGENHWHDGKSAKEIAKYFLNDSNIIPKEILDVIKEILPAANGVWEGIPEKVTRIDNFRGGQRHHDLLIISDSNNSLVIGIEAKAGEKLSNYVSIERDNTKKLSESSNKKKRINMLRTAIFGDTGIDENLIRYQLFTATVGTIEDAMKKEYNKALLIVLSFTNDEISKKDVENYIKILGYNGNDGIGPYKLFGYQNIEFFIKYLSVCNEINHTIKII